METHLYSAILYNWQVLCHYYHFDINKELLFLFLNFFLLFSLRVLNLKISRETEKRELYYFLTYTYTVQNTPVYVAFITHVENDLIVT